MRLVLRMCDRFHALPSAVLKEDATVLRMLEVEQMDPERRKRMEGGDSEWQ